MFSLGQSIEFHYFERNSKVAYFTVKNDLNKDLNPVFLNVYLIYVYGALELVLPLLSKLMLMLKPKLVENLSKIVQK